ncbi:MAG: hypothetical protein NZ518_10030, partial [Dehalococcoidia bacterium]|nr:hypothetical protein [Dehalococcoidia bacterium]
GVGRVMVGALAVWALAFGPWTSVTQNYALLDRSNDRQHEQRANTLLNALEPNAVLVLNEDWLAIWQIKYQRYIAGVRPDTIVIHGVPDVELQRALDGGRPAYSMAYAPTFAANDRLVPVLSFWKALTTPIAYRPLQPVDATFDGKLRLEGWTTPSATIAPGEILPVKLRWLALDDLDTDYVVFVHLLDAFGRSPTGWDSQPLLGESQTSTWRKGERHDDPHGLLLPANLPPGRYTLAVGLYPEGSTTRLPMTAPGAPPADRVELGPLRVAMGSSATPVGLPRSDSFAGLMTLIGAEIGAPHGGSLPVALTWRADRAMNEDYTLTLQLLDASGAMVAQLDRQPVNNTYPTTFWDPGEIVIDRYRLPLGAVKPGSYQLIAAWYDRAVRRLPVNGADALVLGTVTIP